MTDFVCVCVIFNGVEKSEENRALMFVDGIDKSDEKTTFTHSHFHMIIISDHSLCLWKHIHKYSIMFGSFKQSVCMLC